MGPQTNNLHFDCVVLVDANLVWIDLLYGLDAKRDHRLFSEVL
jgi:hypothetical protein